MDMKTTTGKNGGFLLTAILVTSTVLVLGSCDLLGGGSGGDAAATRTFNAQNLETYSWYQLTAEKKYEGSHCLVYVEQGQDVSASLAREIGVEFDNNVYDKIRNTFAHEEDVDKNGKVILLLLDVRDGGSDTSYVAGYFDETHMLSSTYSNKADMLFMDTNPGLDYLDDFKLTMAHEFQHLVNFSQKYIREGLKRQDAWINEGLSAAAEYVYLDGQNQWKIDYYNQKYNRPPYQTYNPNQDYILQGQYFLNWPVYDNAGIDLLPCYSTVYLFFQWLRLQASNGVGIYKEILQNAYVDYRAVESVANNKLYTGSWNDFLRDWFIANQFNDSSGKYGYKGQLGQLFVRYYISANSGSTSYALYPGEAVLVEIGDTNPTFTPGASGTSIEYAAINLSSKSLSLSAPFAAGDIILSYNTTGYSGTYQVASLPTAVVGDFSVVQAIVPAASLIPKSKSAVRTRYPVDAVLGPEREVRTSPVLQDRRFGR